MFASSMDLSCFQNHPLRRPPRATPRPHVTAYALPLRQGAMAQSPRDVLGVAEDADATTIKTAFRRLALKYHPDRQGDEGHFMEILRAYEVLIGKSDGKDSTFEADWEFHDWYWKFTMNRNKNDVRQTSASSAPFQADLPSQLAGLRERAAIRRTKESSLRSNAFNQSHITGAYHEDCEECPSDSGGPSDDMISEERYAEEARRRARVNSEETRSSIRHQLTGLRRRSEIRSTL